jgi:hypothetical protein
MTTKKAKHFDLFDSKINLKGSNLQNKLQINRKFHVATEIGSTFFGCWAVTGQLKK